MPYAMSVIVSRAIPEIDGFKPSHRKLLYTMFTMGLLRGDRTKSANIVGQTMKLNPHGDAAIYETMVRLTRGSEALNHPFVDSKGNFGKVYSRDMAYAAARYTEARLDAFSSEIFRDIDKDAVDFADNYDGKLKEPTLLPVTFPNLLVTPNLGIAVGMASSICSFNLAEVCRAAAAYIKNPECDLLKYITGPDFSTGGQFIFIEKDFRQILETGRGTFKLKAKWRYDKKASTIEVYEIPYTTTIEAVCDKVAALVKSGKLREINDVRDESDISGLKIAVELKRSADPDAVMNKLFTQTALLDTFGANFNALVDGRPRTMGAREIIAEWLRFRVSCVRRRAAYQLGKDRDKLHLIEGLNAILLDIDRAVAIVRGTEDEAMVVPNLMGGFGIDERQAEYVAEIRLRNLNRQYVLGRVAEADGLRGSIAGLTDILANERRVTDIITDELRGVAKKYQKPRRTEVVGAEALPSASEDDFIDDYALKVFRTAHGYFKKISLASLRGGADQFVKDDDRIVQEADATNKS
ncbi:MAG: topoisomerase IV, partial [Clostridiales bacterium]|nr:topoisomerase IV [Clostridiales bacterium]